MVSKPLFEITNYREVEEIWELILGFEIHMHIHLHVIAAPKYDFVSDSRCDYKVITRQRTALPDASPISTVQ